jgi:hypothetical protein
MTPAVAEYLRVCTWLQSVSPHDVWELQQFWAKADRFLADAWKALTPTEKQYVMAYVRHA